MAERKRVEIQGVTCFGDFAEDSNVVVIGTHDDGEGYEEIYCNDDECQSWTEVIAALTPWAKRNGIELDELVAC